MESHHQEPPSIISSPKDYRSKVKYNIICRIFFCWIDPLFWVGCHRSLKFKDLYTHPPEADSKYLLDRFNRYWSVELERKRKGHKPRLILVWFKCFWWRIIMQGLLMFIEVFSSVAQSILLGYLSDYFTIEEPTPIDTRDAYIYAMGMALLGLIITLVHCVGFHVAWMLGMLTRILMTSVIYQKILTLSQTVIGRVTVGHIVNLASNDVHKYELGLIGYHLLWINPLHIAVVTYLLYQEVQWCAFIATILIVIQIPIQLILARVFVYLRLKAARMTDGRLKVMNEVISGIRVIKMYGWEYAFRDVVAAIRKNEIYAVMKYYMIRSAALAYDGVSVSLIMFVMFSVYISVFPNELTPRKVFVALSLITYVRYNAILFLIKILLNGSDALVATKRIEKFIHLDELLSHHLDDSGVINDHCDDGIRLMSVTKSSKHMVVVENMNASWGMDDDKLTLQNISFTLDKNSLMAVVGSVGCGKSTLLQCILKELPPMSGSIQVNGSVSYASQEAWIFSATMRENILFGLPYDSERYNAVIEACALDKDIESLPNGDLTIVGERGVTLSGGQKARVNLARAIYREADIYLIDDPLSAVDAAVSRHIFNKCICGILSKKCVILVTHQIQHLNQCDVILELREGCMGVYGDPSNILHNHDIFNALSNGEDTRDSYTIRKQSIPGHDSMKPITDIVQLQDLTEEEEYPLDEETLGLLDNDHIMDEPETTVIGGLPEEENAHGRISMKTYCQYIIAGGGYIFTGIVVLIFILTEINMVLSDWWISDWANCRNESNVTRSSCFLSDVDRIGIFSSLVASLIVFATLRIVLYVLLMLNSSRVLHNRMFGKILRAPILFFDTNPIGRVLNRFSKDVGFLDDRLIQVFYDYLFVLTRFIAIMITASVANPYILILVCGMFAGSIFFRWYFVRTSRDIKRLEALARSPLYSHVSLTLQGLPTIRSLNMTNEALKQFYTYQNQHTQASYMYLVANRWFSIRIDLIVSLFLTFVAFSSIPLTSTPIFNAGLVGLSLTYAITLNDKFQFCLRQSAEVESIMVSAQRVMAYGKLETEANYESDDSAKPPSDWPDKGHIEISDLSYRHSNDGPLVLRGICCDIRPRENIGIVGRTGAGKSSLIGALFRLAEPQGCIKIDGVDISDLGLHDVRTKLSIIPQDPVLFGGTVRYNLDPFNQYDDDHIWRALNQVQLNNVVEGLEGQLDSIVNEGGSNFSVGQKQLFCLARALLRNNTILILDEATANVDLETDGIIQKVIREEFINCTTLTIAHRLDTVMDCDRIMILRTGELIEFDDPYVLLNDPSSYLKKLVDHTGPAAAERLKNIALDAHNKKKSS